MALCTGDIRKELGSDLLRAIERVINDNAGKHDDYYILIHSDWEGRGALKTKLILMKERPPAMLGTLCVYVNNRKGTAEMLHALPLDIPTDHVEMSDQASEGVFNSAVDNNSPILLTITVQC
jgi:hypothetical protein